MREAERGGTTCSKRPPGSAQPTELYSTPYKVNYHIIITIKIKKLWVCVTSRSKGTTWPPFMWRTSFLFTIHYTCTFSSDSSATYSSISTGARDFRSGAVTSSELDSDSDWPNFYISRNHSKLWAACRAQNCTTSHLIDIRLGKGTRCAKVIRHMDSFSGLQHVLVPYLDMILTCGG